MIEEPFQVPVVGVVSDDREGMDDLLGTPANVEVVPEVELEFKYELPPINNPLEVELEDGAHSSEVRSDSKSLSYFNEDDDEIQAESDEIAAIINAGEVNVGEAMPLAIPIPTIIADMESNSNDIIISHYKPKPGESRAKPKPCICTFCNAVFPNQQLFQLHMSNVHSDKRPYPCSHCKKRFALPDQVKVHETIHDPNRFKGEPQFGCDFCDKKYHLKSSLEAHRKKTHLGYKPPIRPRTKIITEHHSVGVRNHRPEPKSEGKVFKCPYCDLKFAMRCLVLKHLRCHTKERPFQCKVCDQRFSSNQSLRGHMRNRHLNPSGNPRPIRPQFMYKQPCPCEICGKVFKVPSQLQKHMTVHTGEKPHACLSCGQRFRLKGDLTLHFKRRHVYIDGRVVNEREAFKCLICGKNGFICFNDLTNHRSKSHRHIPCDPEKEKAYACGICRKPYYRMGQAMVCAVLRHDPTSLYTAMFKHKCPECPVERFGYHSTVALRKHWEKEHTDKPLPVLYRAPSGLYLDAEIREDKLPSITVNKTLAKNIMENGPAENYEFPLYTELDLLPVEFKFYRESIKGKKMKRKLKEFGLPESPEGPFTCDICGATIIHQRNLIRHAKLHEEGHIKTCKVCKKSFRKLKTLRLHEKLHQDQQLNDDGTIRVKRPRGRPPLSKNKSEKDHLPSPYSCGICNKGFRKVKTLRLHEKLHQSQNLNNDGTTQIKRPRGRPRLHKETNASLVVKIRGKVGRPRKIDSAVAPTEPEPGNLTSHCLSVNCVNVNDATAIRSILGNRELRILLSRVLI